MALYKNKRILDVFVSSTQKDLAEHRAIAIDEIRTAGHRAVAMELFDAQDRQSSEFISDCIATCDVFVLILGSNFGSQINGKSYVQFEFDKATQLHKPILAFVPHGDEIRRTEMQEGLLDFRNSVLSSGRQVGQFYLAERDTFRVQFGKSFGSLAKDMEDSGRGGWIRHEHLDDYVHASKIPPQLTKSQVLRELVEPICNFGELFPNIDSDYDEKSCIARFVWRMLATSITAKNGIRRLYLDGGTTTYFASKEFNHFCGKNAAVQIHNTNEKLTIGTNSLLNMIELSSGIQGPIRPYKDLNLFPPPPVSTDYGKTYGAVQYITPQTVMQYQNRGWTFRHPDGKLADATNDFKNWFEADGGYSLAVVSSAGFVTTGDHVGPWVKSHSSMLLQSCIFRSKSPVILMLDGAKWEKKPSDQEGYHVMIDDLNFYEIVKSQPFAIAISTLLEEKATEIKTYMESLDMHVLIDTAKQTRDPRPVYRVLGYNKSFEPLTR
jgi:hypothetical protein